MYKSILTLTTILLCLLSGCAQEVDETTAFSTLDIEIVENEIEVTPTPRATIKPTPTPIPLFYYSDSIQVLVTEEEKKEIEQKIQEYEEELVILAKIVYREARGSDSVQEQAAVIWCVLNRVDGDRHGDTIEEVATAPNQFAWVPNTPVEDEFYELSKDVIIRWLLEKEGKENVGRVLPSAYRYFAGWGGSNHFRTAYRSNDYWDWSLANPYQS